MDDGGPLPPPQYQAAPREAPLGAADASGLARLER